AVLGGGSRRAGGGGRAAPAGRSWHAGHRGRPCAGRQVRQVLAVRPRGGHRWRGRRHLPALRARAGAGGDRGVIARHGLRPGVLLRPEPWALVAIVALDQLTKWLVYHRVALYETVPVIPGLLNITHV